MNWSLMSNGAWDYPADTRGYTVGSVQELTMHGWSLRTCLETTLTYIVKVAVVFLPRHRVPIGDDDNLHVLGLADDSLYRISGQ